MPDADAKTSANPEVTIVRVFDAPRSRVFKAWTDPKIMAKWWGPRDFTNPRCELDVRPGGEIHIHMRSPDGEIFPMSGAFQEIVEPERLVFASAAEDLEGMPIIEALTTVTFEDLDGKTKLTMHTVVVRSVPEAAMFLEGMDEGWAQSMERLTNVVEN